MAKTNDTKGSTGKRYSPEEKKEIKDFLDSKKGERGSVKEAMEKFGISYITVRNIQNGKMENAKPGKKKDSNGNGKEKESKGKPGNAAVIRLLTNLKKDFERLGSRFEKLGGVLGK